jgi:hypothetical protein
VNSNQGTYDFGAADSRTIRNAFLDCMATMKRVPLHNKTVMSYIFPFNIIVCVAQEQ